jgi:TonB family protein
MSDRAVLTYLEIGSGRWYASLLDHIREIGERRRAVEISAEPDYSALDGLIEGRFPWQSLAIHLRRFGEESAPRFEPTAAPVPVPRIWAGRDRTTPALASLAAHILVATLAVLASAPAIPEVSPVQATLVPLYLPADLLKLPEKDTASGGGGGGGRQRLTAPSAGEAPRAADRQFVPPSAEPPLNPSPILVMEPTIVAPQLASLLPLTPSLVGDPMDGIPGPPSSGPGVGGGIGTGQGTGVGPGQGTGLGPGTGAGFGDGVFEVGGGVSSPAILTRVEPVYSEDARRAQYEGTVLLEAIVRKDGSVEIVRVIRNPGFGLDVQAIEALRQWTFRPAMRAGVPVDVAMNIEINFNLR